MDGHDKAPNTRCSSGFGRSSSHCKHFFLSTLSVCSEGLGLSSPSWGIFLSIVQGLVTVITTAMRRFAVVIRTNKSFKLNLVDIRKMYSFPTLSLFGDLVQPYRNQVIVISDSEYKKHQQAEARKQIEALETQAKTYRQYLTNAETTIAALQKEYDLLPEASPGKEQKE